MSEQPAHLKYVSQLHDAVSAVCPIIGVNVESLGVASYTPAAEATQQQIDAADAVLAAFDWTENGYEQRDTIKVRKRAVDQDNIRDAAQVALRAVGLVILDEVNLLRQTAGLAPRTVQQFRNAIRNKIDSGDAD